MKAIIIVEISVISVMSNDLLFHIDLQLLENVGCLNNTLFAALSIIMVWDFSQLPLVQAIPVNAEYKDSWQNLVSFWNFFEIAKLAEVMRQHGDGDFIALLNHVRVA